MSYPPIPPPYLPPYTPLEVGPLAIPAHNDSEDRHVWPLVLTVHTSILTSVVRDSF